ncbi:PAS domain S-box-containing protein [Streptomyces umbrinus]|uniref:PAS domain S-box-containing protein n=1 Tax=Streptomyces umbrinus TaxID=67370 RepID=A0ABU0SZ03_9ACTN|nr:SpoIIE family protein phosphatase [Streptomyces umbrinus]MDQ1027971.1 PAS domain S-box-containing protein [Streptomyces umbrinus]
MERRAVDDQESSPGRDGAGGALTARATVDEHGVVTGWGAGAERLLGYSAAQVLGRAAASLLAEEPTAGDLPPFSELPRWHGTLVLRHLDGHRVEARVLAHHRTPDGVPGGAPHGTTHGTPDQASDGTPDRASDGVADGTPDRASDGRVPGWLLVSPVPGAARARTDDDALVRQGFLDSPCCSTSVYDTDLRFRRSTQSGRGVLGLSDGDLHGLRLTDVLDDPVAEKVEGAMRRALETGETQYLENHALAPGEGREHAWSVHVYRLEDADGRVLGVATTGHDMTEQYWARKRLQLIAEAGTRIGSTLDVTRTAQELANVAVPALADFVSVDLLASLDDLPEQPPGPLRAGDSLALRRIAHQSVFPDVPEAVVALGEVDTYPEGSPPAESLRTGRAVLHRVTEEAIADWVAEDPRRSARIREFGFHSAMTVPLSARGTTLGVVALARHRHPDPFKADDLVLAEELAARAAVCIDNALRYTRERATAVTLQRSLLPQSLPEQAAVEVASRYLPAGARAGVGGDWFDVIPLSGTRVALVVGDVVGHGIHASATMGRLRTAVRTLADIDLPPDELLTHLDDLVGRLATETEGAVGVPPDRAKPRAWGRSVTEGESRGDVGATCLYAVYDPVSRRCTLARAGHPPPAVVSPDGTVELLDLPAGPPLGLGGLPFESLDTELPEGSLLALYTDGLIESRDSDLDEGTSRLRRALAASAVSLEALCDSVLAAVLPRRPSDDVALLIARTRALDTDRVAAWDIDPDPAAVGEARKNALGRLAAWGLSDAAFVTELIVSELVTNAIRHAAPPIQLRLIHDRTLICEVSDASSTAPHMRRARTYDEGGRGLLLVAQLTQRRGTRPTPTGKTIWAEQSVDPDPDTSFTFPGPDT